MMEYLTISLTEFNRSVNKYLGMINENRCLVLARRNGERYVLRCCTAEEIEKAKSSKE